MTRGKFYVAGKNGEIMEVDGYTHNLVTSKGNIVRVGLYHPNKNGWIVVERTTGLYICVGGTKDKALSCARLRSDLVYRMLTVNGKIPQSYIAEAIDRMQAYLEEQAEKPFK